MYSSCEQKERDTAYGFGTPLTVNLKAFPIAIQYHSFKRMPANSLLIKQCKTTQNFLCLGHF